MNRRPLLLALLPALLLAVPSAPAEDPGEVRILDATVRFRGAGGPAVVRGMLQARGDLLAGPGSGASDPRAGGIRLTVGPSTLLDAAALPEGTRLRTTRSGAWRLRVRRAFDGRGTLSLRMQPGSGLFRLVARGFDAGPLHDGGTEAVPVTLTLGGETWTTAVDFEEEGARRWVHSYRWLPEPPTGGGGSGGGGGGTPPPPYGGLPFQTLAFGAYSNIGTFRVAVVRDTASWQSLWQQHGGAGAPPAVDFSTEMVIGFWLGTRPTTGYTASITGVHVSGGPPNGSGIVLSLLEIAPGPGCVTGQALTLPFHIVKTARVDGTTLWEQDTATNCP